MKHEVTKAISRDLRTPRLRVSRPEKRETLAQIVAVANHASLARDGKAKSPVIKGAHWAEPSKPHQSERNSNWSTPAQRTDAKLARLISPRR